MKYSLSSSLKVVKQINLNQTSLIILLVGILIRIPLLFSPLTYPVDIWRQADTASIAHHFLVNGFNILYPQIYWGGSGPGYVEAEFQLYPFIVALFYHFLGEQLWLGRLVSFFFSVLTIIVFYLFARKIVPPQTVPWSLILFVFSPLFIRYSVAFTPEATVMCFYMGALYFFCGWLDKDRFSLLLLAAGSTALAILVKPTSIHIGMIFALLANGRYGKSIIRDWRIWFAVIVSLLPGALYYWHARDLYLEYGNTFGVLSGGDSKFGNLIYWSSSQFYLGVLSGEGKWVLTPLAAPVFLIGFLQSFRRRQVILISGVITMYLYYFLLARYSGFSFRGIQYHIYMVPFASLGFGVGVDWLLNHKYRLLGDLAAVVSLLAVIAWSATLYPQMLWPAVPASLMTCAKRVQQLVPEHSYIIVSSLDYSYDYASPSIPNNYQEPMVFFYSQRHGWSLPADWLTVQKLQEFRREGAGYYIILNRDKALLAPHPDVMRYLDTNARQIGPGIDAACGIYQFD